MQTASKQLWASLLAAIVGSLCCVAPKATSAKLTQATTQAGFPSKVVSKP
jgi:hypothetical protein